jgi:hypothetical protein
LRGHRESLTEFSHSLDPEQAVTIGAMNGREAAEDGGYTSSGTFIPAKVGASREGAHGFGTLSINVGMDRQTGSYYIFGVWV